ncbi:uncharacterized protein LOC126633558 [Malus sylvestris]|uniref:uncharacterized protein LOC126633558 n=1 Tax=Malus sylvestris TaxID=3752 RepID=UPI0021ABBD31|nr:uncharacterized protein LOC126633558 [Malus sylvestris]
MVTGLMIIVMATMGLIMVKVLLWEQMAIKEVLEVVPIKAMGPIMVKVLIWGQTIIREAMDSLEAIKGHSILRIIVGHSIQTGMLMGIMLRNLTLGTNTKEIMVFLLIKARVHNHVLMASLPMVVLRMVLLGITGRAIQISDPLLHPSAKFVHEGDTLHPTAILGVLMVQILINIKY